MGVEIPRPLSLPGLAGLLRNLGSGWRLADRGRNVEHLLLSAEMFQAELAVLGLSGTTIGPEDYAAALSRQLSLAVDVCVIPDADYPGLKRRWALTGHLAELHFSATRGHVGVLVPGSLPPLALVLTILHELGHLAAGDHLIDNSAENGAGDTGRAYPYAAVRPARRLAQRLPFKDESLREREADLRASYALIAGCLGAESPHALRMFDIL